MAKDNYSFALVSEIKSLVQRERQARQGCLKRVCPEFCTDAKPYKHTQTLTLRKIPYNIANAKLYKHAQTLTPTKSECDNSDAKPCRDTQTFVLKIIK